jgi:hypothetical protein
MIDKAVSSALTLRSSFAVQQVSLKRAADSPLTESKSIDPSVRLDSFPESDPQLEDFLGKVGIPPTTTRVFIQEQFTLDILLNFATFEDLSSIVKPLGLRRKYVSRYSNGHLSALVQ